MNFLSGQCVEGRFVLADGSTLPLPSTFRHQPGEGVRYGIRPEHLHLSDNGIALTVKVVEPTGAETQVIARCGDQDVVCVFRDRVLPDVGEAIRVSPDISRIHLFSEGDGRRLSY
jgi:multiple sugar transport system ATP-binding protein